MRVYILRHADAQPKAPGGTDAQRALSPGGVAQAQRLARDFADACRRGDAPFDVPPRFVISSPAERARVTAVTVAAAFGLTPHCDDDLSCDGPADGPVRVLQRWFDAAPAPVLLVGHNPTCAVLAGDWGGVPSVRTAELIAFEVEARGVELRGRELGRLVP